MSGVPPSESLLQSVSTSCLEFDRTTKDTDGLNENRGPALIAMNGWPHSVNETMSVSPDGVSWSVVVLVIFESGKSEE
jgi:hypothetical protein